MKLSFARGFDDWLRNITQRPVIAWTVAIGWLLLIGWLAFFWNLGNIGLIDETEPLFVEAARQMTVTSDWITPYFNGATRFDKPPLIYWLMAIAYEIFGVNEWAARLPSALAGLAITGFCFYALRRFGVAATARQELLPISYRLSPQTGLWLTAWLGATMVALHPQTFFFGHTGYSDMLLNACFGGALLAFFLGYAQPERQQVQARWYLIFYILIALAVLTKGPVGVVLPGLIIACFLLYLGKAREVLREMRLFRGALIVIVLTLPWYILVTLANGEAYINSFFGYHNVERFTSVVNAHAGPWYFHFLIVLIGFAPWSVYLPAAIARLQVFNRRGWQNQPRSVHLGLFALFWFVVVLGFFTIAATKYFSYVLPLMPAASILVALWWSEKIAQAQRFKRHFWSLILSVLFNIVLFLALAAACFFSPNLLNNDPSMPHLGMRIQQAGLPAVGAVIWLGSAIAGTILLLRRQTNWLWGVNLVGFAAFLIFVVMPVAFIVDAERQLPLRQIAQAVVQVEQPGEELIMIAKGFAKPSLVFYTQDRVTYLARPSEALPYIQNAIAQPSSPKSVLLVASSETLATTGLSPNQYQQISAAGVYQLVRVGKAGKAGGAGGFLE